MKNRKKKNNLMLLLILVLFVSVGYALLSTTLNINGTTKVKNATWNIYWDNPQVTDGSVTETKPTIDSLKTTATFNVELEKPGDFYEFTMDAVNDGTIDGMISNISYKLNDTEIGIDNPLPAYLKYSVTYDNLDDLELNQILSANKSEKYRVRVEFNKNIENNELPESEVTLKLDFSVTYVQADDNAVVRTVSCDENLYNNETISDAKYLKLCSKYIDDTIYTYSDNNDGTITLTGFKSGVSLDVIGSVWALPLKIDNKVVTGISGDAFYNRGISSTLVLSPHITSISDGEVVDNNYVGSFSSNDIIGVALPKTLTTIGNDAFANTKLEEVIVPNVVVTVGDNAFRNSTIEKAIIPDSVTTLGANCFHTNPIKDLTIGKNVTSINSSMFEGYRNTLEKLNINMEYISDYAFTAASELTDLKLGNNVKTIGQYSFVASSKLTNVDLPKNLEVVKFSAFYMGGLTSIDLPDSIKTIETAAFEKNAIVGTLKLPKNLTSLGGAAFRDNKIDKIIFNEKLENINGGGTFQNNLIKELTIPSTIKSLIGDDFRNNPIEKLTLSEGIESIGMRTFDSNNLKEVIIPSTVTTIGENAFSKTSTSNTQLVKIVNKTGRQFNWKSVVGSSEEQTFETGTINNSYGSVLVTNN